MLNLATLKLIGYGVGALAVIALLAMVLGWKSERDHLRAWQGEVVAATREASANPKLDKKAVAQQIRFLGQAMADLKAGLAQQNAAVNALAAESDRQSKEAARAVSKAQGRAREAQVTSDRLAASSRSGGRSSAPCEPSKVLTEAWK